MPDNKLETALLDAALAYASRGWKVFPCEEYAKQPRISSRDGGKGCHDGTTNKTQVATWWNRFPNANIGYSCEKYWVLDVDIKSGGPASLAGLENKYGELPNTLRQSTPSGGKHYFFNLPKGALIQNKASFYPGLDSRAFGGYVLVAPSQLEAGAYTWDNEGTPIVDAPDWLIEMVKKTRAQFEMSNRSDTGSRDIDDASLTGALFNMGFNEDELITILQMRNSNPDRRDVPLPTNELIKTVRSIMKRDVHTPVGLMQAIFENNRRVKLEKPEALPDTQWVDRSVKSSAGNVKNCIANAEAALTNSPIFCNSLCFDELNQDVLLKRSIVDPINGKTIGSLNGGNSVDDHKVREMLIIAQRLIAEVTFTEDIFGSAIQAVARANSFNPVADYLHGVQWDGVERINTLLIDHFGTRDNPYTRAVGRRWMIAAVGRALKPGSIANSMLIMEGKQDIGKSKAFKALTGAAFFKDTRLDLNSKDKFGAIRGVWIYELAEFDQYKGHDAAALKSFISSSEDSYRPPYARTDIKIPRCSVFVGTVNPDKYLVDVTGNKRYWPVKDEKHTKHNPINTDAIIAVRDQLWAEAVRAHYAGEQCWLSEPELIRLHEEETSKRMDIDEAWEDTVLDYCRLQCIKRKIQTSDILTEALGFPLSKASNRESSRIKQILVANGYSYGATRINGRVTKCWKKNSQPSLDGIEEPET